MGSVVGPVYPLTGPPLAPALPVATSQRLGGISWHVVARPGHPLGHFKPLTGHDRSWRAFAPS
jgi:hypothetical protein